MRTTENTKGLQIIAAASFRMPISIVGDSFAILTALSRNRVGCKQTLKTIIDP
jgi:hypothetical protein